MYWTLGNQVDLMLTSFERFYTSVVAQTSPENFTNALNLAKMSLWMKGVSLRNAVPGGRLPEVKEFFFLIPPVARTGAVHLHDL